MAFKLLLCVAAVMGAANAGFVGQPAFGYAAVGAPTLTSQSSNTLRSFGNQGQINHSTKSIQTPFSSDIRSDYRATNDAQIVAHGYAAPAYSTYAAAPAYSTYAAPAITKTYAAPAYSTYAAAPAVTAYAAPAAYHAAPAYSTYAAAPAVAAYAAPAAYTKTIAAPATQLLGVAYSAAPAVAHMTYSNGLGIAYSY